LIALAGTPALGQSQADRTGTGGVAAGQEGTPLYANPLVLGAIVAGAIGVMLAVAAADDSPVSTTTVTTTTTR
jgi:hypothetical protein